MKCWKLLWNPFCHNFFCCCLLFPHHEFQYFREVILQSFSSTIWNWLDPNITHSLTVKQETITQYSNKVSTFVNLFCLVKSLSKGFVFFWFDFGRILTLKRNTYMSKNHVKISYEVYFSNIDQDYLTQVLKWHDSQLELATSTRSNW